MAQVFAAFGVNARFRLIEQKELRPRGQRPCQRNALSLTPRKSRSSPFREMRTTHITQNGSGNCLGLTFCHSACKWTIGHIIQDTSPEKIGILPKKGNPAAKSNAASSENNRGTHEHESSFVRRKQTRHHPKECRLPRSIRALQYAYPATAYFEMVNMQRGYLTEINANIIHGESFHLRSLQKTECKIRTKYDCKEEDSKCNPKSKFPFRTFERDCGSQGSCIAPNVSAEHHRYTDFRRHTAKRGQNSCDYTETCLNHHLPSGLEWSCAKRYGRLPGATVHRGDRGHRESGGNRKSQYDQTYNNSCRGE